MTDRHRPAHVRPTPDKRKGDRHRPGYKRPPRPEGYKRLPRKRKPGSKRSVAPRYIVGVDGEGYDTPDGRHVYVYLCASDAKGRIVSEAYNANGLSTEECTRMLLAIPRRALCFGYMFQYDIGKIVEDLEPLEIYKLVRPDLRVRRRGKFKWRKRVRDFDFFAGSLNVKREKRSTHVWDCFRFFGQAFTKALENWNVGTPEERQTIADMKAERGNFENLDIADVRKYCALECRLLAVMMGKVIDAHREAGIPLKRFEGAGSSASVLLTKHGVGRYREPHKKRGELVRRLAACAYFGGHFENSFMGLLTGRVYGFDIRSAYPFAMTTLPCLKCGRWHRTNKLTHVKAAQAAICRVSVETMSEAKRKRVAWQPLPARLEDGSIVFGTGFSGWYHASEALAALRWPGVKFHEAWVYETHCDHDPFGWVPAVYQKRLDWGKDGPGIVLKLAMNAGYGKLAQRIGATSLRSMLWAGMITAFTRAQVLSLLGPKAWHVLAVATDGILSTEDLGIATEKKTLGSWERKTSEGMIVVKPGLYWSQADDRDKFRARGIGRREAWQHRDDIARELAAWDGKNFEAGVTVKSRRFYGPKQSIYAMSFCEVCEKSHVGAGKCEQNHVPIRTDCEFLEAPDGQRAYGRWCEREITIAFNPMPKREARMAGGRLRVRDLGGIESAAYTGITSPEGLALSELREHELEQPDWEEE